MINNLGFIWYDLRSALARAKALPNNIKEKAPVKKQVGTTKLHCGFLLLLTNLA